MSLIYTNYLYNTKDLIPEIEFVFNDFNELTYLKLEIIFYIKEDEPHILYMYYTPKESLINAFIGKLKYFHNFYDINEENVLGVLVNLYI